MVDIFTFRTKKAARRFAKKIRKKAKVTKSKDPGRRPFAVKVS